MRAHDALDCDARAHSLCWQGGQLVPIRGPFEFDVVDVWGDGKGKAVAFTPRHAPDELYLAFRGVRNEMEPPPSAHEMQASLPPAEARSGSDAAAAVAQQQQRRRQQQQQYDTGPSVDRSNFVRFECEEPAWLAGSDLKARVRCMCTLCVRCMCTLLTLRALHGCVRVHVHCTCAHGGSLAPRSRRVHVAVARAREPLLPRAGARGRARAHL